VKVRSVSTCIIKASKRVISPGRSRFGMYLTVPAADSVVAVGPVASMPATVLRISRGVSVPFTGMAAWEATRYPQIAAKQRQCCAVFRRHPPFYFADGSQPARSGKASLVVGPLVLFFIP